MKGKILVIKEPEICYKYFFICVSFICCFSCICLCYSLDFLSLICICAGCFHADFNSICSQRVVQLLSKSSLCFLVLGYKLYWQVILVYISHFKSLLPFSEVQSEPSETPKKEFLRKWLTANSSTSSILDV